MSDVLQQLADSLEARKGVDPKNSYVSSLYHEGMEAILKKVGEEATETILAAATGSDEAVIYETADLWFHTMVMLLQRNLSPVQVLDELQRRFGQSGHVEKATRAHSK